MAVILKILGGVLIALCVWYILLLYKNNRNKL
jgi:hypothetical protein